MAWGLGPLVMSDNVWRAGERRRAAQEAQAHNTGQVATVGNAYTSTGAGYQQPSTIMKFSTTFVAEPALATGAVLLTAGSSSGDYVPTITSGVASWVQDGAGYYTGAKIWVQVDNGTDATVVRHTFTFTGLAIRPTPANIMNVSGAIDPKVPNVGL